MANISAADVKRLRDLTSAGMMDSKKALEEADEAAFRRRAQAVDKENQLQRYAADLRETFKQERERSLELKRSYRATVRELLGGVGARPELIGLVSDADGAIAAIAAAMKLGEMARVGDVMPGSVRIHTHICPNASTKPNIPVPQMRGPLPMFEKLLPRHMQIIYLINWLHLERLSEEGRLGQQNIAAISLIDESNGRRVRMGAMGSYKVAVVISSSVSPR